MSETRDISIFTTRRTWGDIKLIYVLSEHIVDYYEPEASSDLEPVVFLVTVYARSLLAVDRILRNYNPNTIKVQGLEDLGSVDKKYYRKIHPEEIIRWHQRTIGNNFVVNELRRCGLINHLTPDVIDEILSATAEDLKERLTRVLPDVKYNVHKIGVKRLAELKKLLVIILTDNI